MDLLTRLYEEQKIQQDIVDNLVIEVNNLWIKCFIYPTQNHQIALYNMQRLLICAEIQLNKIDASITQM